MLDRQGSRIRATLGVAAAAAILVTAVVLLAPLVKGRHGSADGAGGSGSRAADPLLGQVESAFAKQQWAEAERLQTRLAAAAPDLPRAAELGEAIRNERRNQATLQAAEQALDLEDYASVLSRTSNIGSSSVYRDRARALAQTARSRLVAQHLRAARGRQREGDCQQAKKEAAAALALESDNAAGKEIISRCTRVAMGQPSTARPGRFLASSRRGRAATRTPAIKPVMASPPAPSLMSLPERPARRPIESKNPYAGDVR